MFGNIVKSLFIGAIFSVTAAFAGRGDKAGTSAGSELLLPVGARVIALGGSSLATVAGLESAYWNPAGLTHETDGTNAMVSHMTYLADIGVDYAALSTNISDIVQAAASIKSISFGQIPITTADQPDGTGQFATPSYTVIGATISRAITDHIAFGLTANYLIENMEQVSTTGFAFTAGLQYMGLGGINGLNLGVVVRNIGAPLQYGGSGLIQNGSIDNSSRGSSQVAVIASTDDLPSTIEIGMGYKFMVSDGSSLNMTSAFVNNNYSDDEYSFGAEFQYSNFLYLRGGFHFLAQDQATTDIFGPAGGIGLQSTIGGVNVSLDYAYRVVQYFNGNHIISLQFGF
ncbi:MAG TPA: PorV/PorQ family protein [Bacteroidota bacterium]|nr:PorV/PorQ family protein [Bacteroidota bacterium]